MLAQRLDGEERQRDEDQNHARGLGGAGPLAKLNRSGQHAHHRNGQGPQARGANRQMVEHVHPEHPRQGGGGDGVVDDGAHQVGCPVQWLSVEQRRDQHQRQASKEGLPRGQPQQIDLDLGPQAFHHHVGNGPRHARAGGQQARRETAVDIPGLHDEQQSGQGQQRRRPLQGVDALAQQGPGQGHEPEGHGVGEHRCPSRPAPSQGQHDAAGENGGLEQPQHQHPAGGHGLDGPAENGQQREQAHGAQQIAQRAEIQGPRVTQHLLHHHPVVAPDQSQCGERQSRAAGGGGWEGHVSDFAVPRGGEIEC